MLCIDADVSSLSVMPAGPPCCWLLVPEHTTDLQQNVHTALVVLLHTALQPAFAPAHANNVC